MDPVHVKQIAAYTALCDAHKPTAELAAITDHEELQALRNALEDQLLIVAGNLLRAIENSELY